MTAEIRPWFLRVDLALRSRSSYSCLVAKCASHVEDESTSLAVLWPEHGHAADVHVAAVVRARRSGDKAHFLSSVSIGRVFTCLHVLV